MLFLKNTWGWCVKHWKALLITLGGFIAFIIGFTKANRETQRVKLDLKIKEQDVDLLMRNKEILSEASVKAVFDFQKKKEEIQADRDHKLANIEIKKEEMKKDILNSDGKLDKILKDEWGLEKE